MTAAMQGPPRARIVHHWACPRPGTEETVRRDGPAGGVVLARRCTHCGETEAHGRPDDTPPDAA